MIIERHPSFKRAYKKRIAKNAKLVEKVSDRLKLFANDPNDVMLKDHSLGFVMIVTYTRW